VAAVRPFRFSLVPSIMMTLPAVLSQPPLAAQQSVSVYVIFSNRRLL
jgi:hypothetical protein